jgi:hypothetical protein
MSTEPPPERDRLEQAIACLREFGRELPPEVARTRVRVLSDAAARRRPRLGSWLLATGMLAFAVPALAHFTGQLPALTHAIATFIGVEREARSGPATHRPERAAQAPGAGAQGVALSAAPASRADVEAPAETDRPRSAAPKRAAHELYLVAHRLHFGGASPDAAVRAWDAFLRAAPRDSFAPEARYNRAIALLKLGRFEAALAALEPFACSAPGAYRQREARELIGRARAMQSGLPAPACERGTR